MTEEKNRYETVLKNGSISLPKEVVKKLKLREGDKVIIRIGKVRDLPYVYVSSEKAEVADVW